MDNKEIIGKIKYLINKGASFQDICLKLELKDYEVIGLVELMKQNGELVDYLNGEIIKLKKPVQDDNVYIVPNNLEKLKLLLISDSHLCNKADRLDILNYLYDKANNKEVQAILHCGDLLDGMYLNRPQHIYELKKVGFDEHLEYVVEKYPRLDNIKTFFIGGNHMDTYFKNSGADMGKAISREREDLVYLNPDTADLKFGKVGVHMHHGGGGRAYSLSYKLQRYVESLPQNKKIDIVMQGHYHNAMYMYYMGKHCFQVGALEDDTPFSRSMGFKNEKSCYWLDISLDDKGEIHSLTPELETFEKRLIRKK
jgi:predicted phosphodiesterase